MRNKVIVLDIIFVILMFSNSFAQNNEYDYAKHADPFWGAAEDWWTGGHTFAGAAMPFGMVKLGPDCNNKNTNSGYDRNGKIHGFSHTHASGAGGNPKYGNILVMATRGEIDVYNYGSERINELAEPGFFSVDYTDYNINAEFTVTHSVGFHRYRFNEGGQSNILFDLGSYLTWVDDDWTQEFVGSGIQIISDTEIQGYSRIRKGWGNGDAYTVYFYAVLDTPAQKAGTWKSGKINPKSNSEADTGDPVGGYFSFDAEKGQVISVKVGISFLGVEKAKSNISKEIDHWNFSKIKDDAYNAWNKELGKIKIQQANKDYLEIFYSALYHAFLQPTDRTGENPKWNSDKPYYDDFYCIWDTFRATHPLILLINPERQAGMINALLDIYKNEGYMPDARSGNSTGITQGGSNSDVLIADAFVKGLKGIDYSVGLNAMIKNAEVPPGGNEDKYGRAGIPDYNSLGYLAPEHKRAGSRTMEYAFNDYCIAVVADGLGKKSVADKYLRRSDNWKNLWNTFVEDEGAKGFIIPRDRDGSWQLDWDLHHVGSLDDWLYEGNSWEYSFYVPHNIAELIHYCGGTERFEQRLDTFFTKKSVSTNPHTSGYYNVSNEPSFLTPLLYNYIGKQWKSSRMIHRILRENYTTGIDGLPGNDDSGSMSAWYVFHTLGFYPVAGTDVYLISSPKNQKSEIIISDNKKIIINAEGVNDKNIYIQSCNLNGKPYNRSWFRHSDIIDGAVIDFIMGDKPSKWSMDGELPSLYLINIRL
ncbi:GH92 family glycosyl hydrolase [Proteiniphilum acetatigenes]|uniref:GH92 family glycosyl hydrolase n=1 Tax=Proteiniphilum acetatigenes TaxID=294710 RepID=UPI0003761B8C|nr:GH92 family glycosyl hydrolase [Proteiniphilum acetatigenes]